MGNKIFIRIGFDVDIKTNLNEIHSLDLTFNLKETYHRFRKQNDTLLYMQISFNHPPTLFEDIPQSINHRLSENSSNKTIFNKTKKTFETALKTENFWTNYHTLASWIKK